MDLLKTHPRTADGLKLSKATSFYKKSLFFALFLSLLMHGNAFSQLEVTNTNSSGAGSLLQAISDATSGQTITFNTSLNGGTISGLGITIAKNLTIDASTLASGITLQGFGNSPVFTINSGNVTLRNLIITNPSIDDTFTIGGIANYSTLTVENTHFVNIGNLDGPTLAAGVFNEDGASVTISKSTFGSSSFGSITGASTIRNEGNMDLTNVTFTGLDSGGDGLEVIFNSSTGSVVANHITIYDNFGVGIRNNAVRANFELNYSLIDQNFDLGSEGLYGPFFGDNNVFGEISSQIDITGSDNFFGDVNLFISALADNGGPVPTNAIFSSSSPAVDRATSSAENQDARGKFANGARDAGAYEFNGLDPEATLGQLTQGIASSPLPAGVNNLAVLGFSLTSNVTQTLTGLNFSTSSEPDGKFFNWRLFTSADNNYSTSGDNTEVTGITIATPNASTLNLIGLNEALTTSPKHFFLVAQINGAVNNTTPNLQLSLTQTGVTVDPGVVNTATITGTNYSFTRPFETTWETTAGGETITIPTATGETYNYFIDWGDGTTETITTDTPPSHSYTTAGTHTVSISGDFPRIFFAGAGDISKIQSIEQWGEIAWVNMRQAFQGCANMAYNATDAPDLSGVADMTAMFSGCTSITTPDLTGWDVSGIQSMASTFFGATNFNGDISSWTTSSLERIDYMFSGAEAFNQNISSWDVSQVVLMNNTFEAATAFNNGEAAGSSTAPLSWTTSALENTLATFRNASSFNQNINAWNVSGVTDMFTMFDGASVFNQPLDSWDVSLVTSMGRMFRGAARFNQPLNSNTWNTANVDNFGEMFYAATDFDQALDNNWSLASAVNLSGMFAFASSFNQPLDQWGATKPNNVEISFLFEGASMFNQPLPSWDVSGNINLYSVFKDATNFNQDLSNWDISNIIDDGGTTSSGLQNMLDNTALTAANYDATLLGWSTQTVQSNLILGALGLNYCDATGRDDLIDNDNWTINDAGPTVDPAALPQASESSLCTGGSFNFSIGAAAQTGYSYKLYSGFTDLTTRGTELGAWTEGEAATAITLTAGLNGITSGNNVLTVVGEDAGLSCEAVLDQTLTITVNPLPTGVIAGDATFCEGASTDLTFTLTGTGPYDVTYNDGSADVTLTGISDGHLETVSPTSTTTYTLVSVTDANGCAATDLTGSATITVNPLPTVAIAGDATICEGAATDLSFTLTGTGPYDVTYNNGNDDIVLTGINDGHLETVSPTITTTYTLVSVTDANGCVATTVTGSATVTINPAPTVAITGDATICEGASTDLTFTLTGTGPYDVTYSDGNGQLVITGINDGHLETVSPTTITTYSLVSVTDANGCAATAVSGSTTITVNPLPTITIDAQEPFCLSDEAATLVANPPGGTWSGTGITDGTAGTFEPTTAGVGTFTITYTVTELGCTNAETIDISVLETPDASINGAGPFCSADAPITLSALNTGGSWSGTGITDAATGLFDPAEATIGDNVITYTLEVSGCQDVQTTTIVVNEGPQVSIGEVGTICLGTTPLNLTATPSGGQWSGEGITDPAAGIFDPAVAGTGTSLITYTVSVDGCTGSNEISLEVLTAPQAAAEINGPNNFCAGDEVVYTTSLIEGAESYQWETPSGSVNTDTPELTYTGQEAGEISVAGVNSCGAGIAASISYSLAPAVNASFDFSTSPLSDLEYQFTNTSTGDVNSWVWDFGDGSSSNSENPDHTYELPGEYTVSLTASNGFCEDVITQTITVSTEIIINISNVITANGNGQNDFIYIENIEKYTDHEVQLLNRWGKVVFSSTNFSNTPESVSNKPELEAGNYVCIVMVRFAGMEVKRQQLITVVK